VARNDEGEFELVLGNKQLLSVFFLVVVLLAVFFTAGYLVGRNSMPLVAANDGAPRNDSKPLVVDSAVPATPPSTAAKAPEERPKEPITTAPQQPPETASKPASEKAPEKAPEKAAEKKESAKAATKEAAKSEAKAPSAGQTYLQLSATAKAEAEVMVDVLRKRNFAATAVEIPEKPGTFRVLVGPIQAESVNKTKSDLQAAGFPGDKAIKRTF
jgi:cell division septation protein DedD